MPEVTTAQMSLSKTKSLKKPRAISGRRRRHFRTSSTCSSTGMMTHRSVPRIPISDSGSSRESKMSWKEHRNSVAPAKKTTALTMHSTRQTKMSTKVRTSWCIVRNQCVPSGAPTLQASTSKALANQTTPWSSHLQERRSTLILTKKLAKTTRFRPVEGRPSPLTSAMTAKR